MYIYHVKVYVYIPCIYIYIHTRTYIMIYMIYIMIFFNSGKFSSRQTRKRKLHVRHHARLFIVAETSLIISNMKRKKIEFI